MKMQIPRLSSLTLENHWWNFPAIAEIQAILSTIVHISSNIKYTWMVSQTAKCVSVRQFDVWSLASLADNGFGNTPS